MAETDTGTTAAEDAAEPEASEETDATAETAIDPVATTTPAAEAPLDDAHDEHPEPAVYVKVAIILAIATAIEIALYYLEEDMSAQVVTISLIVLMTVKFLLVALWFMHLKFDAPLFKRIFYGGTVLAVTVYAIVLGVSGIFPILV